MPDYLPEDNQPAASDNPLRSLHKCAGLLFDLVGNQGPSYFPEGSQPQPDDGEGRLLQKMNAMFGG
jgi:hypothetical protein